MKDIDMHCKCSCENAFHIIFRIEDEENYAIISTLTAGYYMHQTDFFGRMKRRIKAAWHMLMGKEFYLHEVILDKEQWNNLVNEINKHK